MIAVILKFIHVATIALWSAGLFSLPFLYLQRKGLTEERLFRLHAFTRFLYVGLVSPAALVAIATGTALIFLEATFEVWFSVKLFLVGLMAVIHLLSGLMILRLFEPDQHYPKARFVIITALTASVITAILVVVLGKPRFDPLPDFDGFFAPGALGEKFGWLIAWMI